MTQRAAVTSARVAPTPGAALVHQFLVVLTNTDPLVWRRLQLPASGTFWDLHIAIQDAMGWEDRHLHEFRFVTGGGYRVMTVGIPDEHGAGGQPVVASWDVPLATYFDQATWGTPPLLYLYDFGDEWQHIVTHEGVLAADEGSYPRCTGGAMPAPPEECGGVQAYADMLARGEVTVPAVFDPLAVTFTNPARRLRRALR